jgi:DNA repair photolyase
MLRQIVVYFVFSFVVGNKMAKKQWDKVTIRTDSGETQTAVAPVIISASRATDIPAFYSEWFFDRLNKGYLRRRNPFSGSVQCISFEKVRLIVFWTKDPARIIPHLPKLDALGINYYFQVTLTDYEQEQFEPNVPSLDKRIETFRRLSSMIGKERVLWRFDPLIATDAIGVNELVDKVSRTGDLIYRWTSRLTISFLVHYAKVTKNCKATGIPIRNFTKEETAETACRIAQQCKEWGIPVVSCAVDRELKSFGVAEGKCIDNRMIADLFHHDKTLMEFIGAERDLLGLKFTKDMKDPGQRAGCGCIMSKDIGAYATCPHLCVYCYANNSPGQVKQNRSVHCRDNDILV